MKKKGLLIFFTLLLIVGITSLTNAMPRGFQLRLGPGLGFTLVDKLKAGNSLSDFSYQFWAQSSYYFTKSLGITLESGYHHLYRENLKDTESVPILGLFSLSFWDTVQIQWGMGLYFPVGHNEKTRFGMPFRGDYYVFFSKKLYISVGVATDLVFKTSSENFALPITFRSGLGILF